MKKFALESDRIKPITGSITGHQFDVRAIRIMDDCSGITTVHITVCDKGGACVDPTVYKKMSESEYKKIQPDSDLMDSIIADLMKELRI